MTRKDYVLIAAALKAAGRGVGYDVRDAGRLVTCDIAKELCARLARDNAQFDKERFLAACGVSE